MSNLKQNMKYITLLISILTVYSCYSPAVNNQKTEETLNKSLLTNVVQKEKMDSSILNLEATGY